MFTDDSAGGDPEPRETEIAAVEWFGSAPGPVVYPAVARRPFPAVE